MEIKHEYCKEDPIRIKEEPMWGSLNSVKLEDESQIFETASTDELPIQRIKEEGQQLDDGQLHNLINNVFIKRELENLELDMIKTEFLHTSCDLPTLKDENDALGDEQISNMEELLPVIDTQSTEQNEKRGKKRKQPENQIFINKVSDLNEECTFLCARCCKTFKDLAELEAHNKSEHATLSLFCEQCGEVSRTEKARLIHINKHKIIKSYVCDICGRSFSQSSHLCLHMRFHQGIKPFVCHHEGCVAKYTIRPDLEDHIRKAHTRERPFKCNVCNKCFLTGPVFYQHRLIHTNDRRYPCDLCPKRFFRADALTNHRRIHTDERPYVCQVCGRGFRQKGDCNKHRKSQHPDSN